MKYIPEFCARGYLVLGGGGYWEDTIQRRMNMTLQDGDLLQGLIIFGGCGEFDGYITLGGHINLKNLNLRKKRSNR